MENRFDIKVLFVDDDTRLLDMRRLCFSDYFSITTASDIGDALRAVKSRTIDIVVTDKNMGGYRGIYPLLEYLQYEQPETPVIINSGEDGIRARKELYCHGYIEKNNFSGSSNPIQMYKERIVELVDRMNRPG